MTLHYGLFKLSKLKESVNPHIQNFVYTASLISCAVSLLPELLRRELEAPVPRACGGRLLEPGGLAVGVSQDPSEELLERGE
jgi:hypothetical protein